jgi:KDO2-lipid IV(A) lauroyltransferase
MATALSAPESPAPEVPRIYRIEAWIAVCAIRILRLLPLDWASALGGGLARAVGPRFAISRRARLHLKSAMPELSEDEVTRIVRGMWDNLGRVAFEFPHVARIDVFAPNGRVEVRGFDHVTRALAAGRGIIFFSGHIGNWELNALALGQHGVDVAIMYRAANNPLIDQIVARLRDGYGGGELIPKGDTASRRVMARLRRGAHVGMLVDQKLNNGIAVPFFGRDAMTAPALAVMALRMDCDVLPMRVERLGGARFRLTVYPRLELPDSGDREADTLAVMTEVNRTLENWIRERPDQWFWLHRRWPD